MKRLLLALIISTLAAAISLVGAPADQDFEAPTDLLFETDVALDGVIYDSFAGGSNLSNNLIIDDDSFSGQLNNYFAIHNDPMDQLFIFNTGPDGVINYGGPGTGAVDFRISSSDGAEFRLVSMEADAGAMYLDAPPNYATTFVVKGYRDGAEVASDTIDFSAGDSAGSVTYVKTGLPVFRGGTLTFTSAWENIDELRFTAGDGSSVAVLAIDNLDFEAALANAAPVLTLDAGSQSYTENAAAVRVSSGATVFDAETNWNGGTLAVQISANAQATDTLAIGGATGLTVSGTNLMDGGTTFATLSVSGGSVTGNTTLTLTFNANGTDTRVQNAIQAMTFVNSSEDPSTSTRTVTFVLTDAAAASDTEARSISVAAVNDAPTLTATGSNPTFTEGGSAVDLFSSVTASTVEAGQTFAALTLTIANVGDGENEILSIDGTEVVLTDDLDGTLIGGGDFSITVVDSTATVDVVNLTRDNAQMGALVDGITYRNTDTAPGTTARVVTLTGIKDSGGTSNDGVDTTSLSISSTVTVQPIDNDGALTAAGGVNEPIALGTTAGNAFDAVNVFDFTISDGGASDGLPLTVSQIVVRVSGSSTDAERGKVTWRLNGPGALNVTGTYDAGADTLTFSALTISVANGGNETYTVNAYYPIPRTGLTDGHTIILSIDGDTDLTVGAGGTQMGSTSPVTNGTGTTIEVEATRLMFTIQPAGSVSGVALTTQPVVTAQDVNGNTDVNFSETVTLTQASAGELTNHTQPAVAGVATFTNLIYTATADQQAFTLTADDQDGVGSNLPPVDADAVTADVVATKLIFQTQPSPLTTKTGLLLNFSTDPVVQAVDANDIVDTDYVTGIVLAEVNGAGSATIDVAGDVDGSGATVTLTPTSGAATFENLAVIYTNSGATAETFNLRAFSVGLTTADSSQITSSGLPAVTSATYNAASGVLVVTGTDFEANGGVETADVNVSALTLTGEGGATRTLTSSADVEIDSATQFTVTLHATDKAVVNLMLNKNGPSSTGGTNYNLAVADNFITAVTAGDTADPSSGVTVTDVANPAIVSAAYNYAANTLTLTGTGFKSSGATDDIDVSAFTVTGEGGATYTLSTSADVEITNGTSATIALTGADVPQVEALLNQDGTLSATSETTFNLAVAEDWNHGADAGETIADATISITVSDYASPAISSATYDASNGVLVVTGTDFVAASGATNDVDASQLTLRGGVNETYTLTDTSDGAVTSATQFTVILSAADKLSVNGVLNKDGTESGSATLYNLEAADNWMTASPAANDITDTAGNGITVSNTQTPTITSATYDFSTGTVVVTGTHFVRKPGAANDVDLSTLTFTGGDANATYTLVTATDVEITSATSFTFTLSGADKTHVDTLLDQLGTGSSGGSTYNLATADNWLTGADDWAPIADAGPNAITVSIPPSITSASYDATSGSLVVTGANFQANGSGLDVDASAFTFTGEGGATYTLTDTSNIERDSLTQFTFVLSATDKAAVNQILNKDGEESTGGTIYSLAAADDYLTAVTDGDIADGTNPLTVSGVPVPTITSATYNVATGLLTVTGTGFVKFAGDTNDIDVWKLTVEGEGGGTRPLTSASVEITDGTTFSVTLNADDQTALIPLLNKDGTNSSGSTTYNLAAHEGWAAGADAGVDVVDESGNGITVNNADAVAPTVTSVTSSTANGSYGVDAVISIQVNFTENVYVVGAPQLTLETGATDRTINYSGGNGTSSLSFLYTVQAGDTSADLDYVATGSLMLNGGTIRDLTGNNAVLTLAAPGAANSISANQNLVVDTTPPEVSSIVRQSPTTVNTDATSITYRVTLDGGVTGVDVADFVLTAPGGNDPASTATGTIASVTAQSADVYDVVVNAVSGQGQARLDLKSTGTGIVDLAGNALADGGYTTGEFYFVGATNVCDTVALTAGAAVVTVSDTATHRVAQRFTTGSVDPFSLTSVVASLGAVNGATPKVDVYMEDDLGMIGDHVVQLTNPGSLVAGALNVWTSTELLLPQTSYWIVFAATAGNYEINTTTATNGGEGGWLNSTANYLYRGGDVTDAGNTPTVGALRIALGATSVPSITSVLTASGTYGSAFSYQITATNTPTSYAATNLPPGLSLNTTTGVISGSPAQSGTFNAISLTATNGSGTSAPATLVLTISSASANVSLASLTKTYTGQPLAPTVVTSPSGLPVSVTYNGSTTVPTEVGSYSVMATVTDPDYSGSGSGTFTITKAAATLTLGNLSHTYDGTAKSATVTTVPAGLDVTLSYNPASPTLPGSYTVTATVNAPNHTGTATGTLTIVPAVTAPPVMPPAGGIIELSVGNDLGGTGQWQRNGANLPTATGSSLTLTDVQPPTAGLYTYTATLPGGGSGTSEPLIVGLTTDEKVVGQGAQVLADVVHPNGNVYDQVLLEGNGASITADPNKITRVSFVDLTNDIVQVEFSGAGTLSIVMDDASMPAPPINYNQAEVDYVRGHVGLVITGANETSNLSIFSVGPITAVNQTLFKEDVIYDGVADIAFVAIQSANGKFGGIRTGNTSYYASQGFTGVYAPGVEFAGPINIGDVSAFDSATPVLVFGSAGTVHITGGNLEQPNEQAVRVSGIAQVRFVDGTTSQGVTLPAQANEGVLVEDGVDVTDLIVEEP